MFQVNALAGSVPSSASVAVPLKEMTSPALKNVPSAGDVIDAGPVPGVDRDRRSDRRR